SVSSSVFCFSPHPAPPALPSFPTRRSSDLSHTPRRSTQKHAIESAPSSTTPSPPPMRPTWCIPTSSGRSGCSPGGRNLSRVGCRSEEHTSELQSRENLVCRLLLEKKKR